MTTDEAMSVDQSTVSGKELGTSCGSCHKG